MVKQAPTLGRMLTMVLFALSCFGLLLFLWLSFGGPTPLKPKGYRFDVAFPEATQLGLEADVRVAGVSVGKVRVKDIQPKDAANRTYATLEINPRYAPVREDAKAILRQKTLLGETYVELTPGTPGAKAIPEGGRLRDAQVAPTVELDEIFQALDPVTRKSFQSWQQDLARAGRGRGADLNDALGNLPTFAASGSDLLAVLDAQGAGLRRTIRGTGDVFAALTQDEAQLRNLITGSSDVFTTTARERENLAETFRILPTFLDESKRTFRRLETFSTATRPLVRELRPAIRDLRPTLQDAKAFAPDLERTFRSLDPLITASKTGLPALKQVLDGTKPLLGELQPFLEELNPILEWLEVNQSFVTDFFSNGGQALADTVPTTTEDERGHYLRQFSPNGTETAGIFTSRLNTNRGNAYPRPDSFTGPDHARKMIFANFDCKNTGEGGTGEYMTQVPNTSDKPSCFVMKPPSYPPGNTRQYPVIAKADYSK